MNEEETPHGKAGAPRVAGLAVNAGLGTILQLSVASTFTTVANRVTIDGPTREVTTAETTTLDSTVRTFRGVILDNGEVSGTLYFDPQDPTHLALTGLLTAFPIAPGSWKLKFADAAATTYSFSGPLTKLALNGMEIEGNLGADFTIKVSGPITESHT